MGNLAEMYYILTPYGDCKKNFDSSLFPHQGGTRGLASADFRDSKERALFESLKRILSLLFLIFTLEFSPSFAESYEIRLGVKAHPSARK